MRKALLAATALAALAAGLLPAAAKDPITIQIDRAKVMRLPAPAGMVIIGNPGIADANVQDRTTLVLTGKAIGLTNLVVLDAKGNPIADETLAVARNPDGMVTVQRAGQRYSYSCTPTCNPTIEAGDTPDHYSQAMSQIMGRNNFAQQTGTGQP